MAVIVVLGLGTAHVVHLLPHGVHMVVRYRSGCRKLPRAQLYTNTGGHLRECC